MELSQSRPFGTAQGSGRKATHDFLSLHSHSSIIHQDSRPSHGGFLKTHNFLQSPEGEDASKEDNSSDINLDQPPPAAPPSLASERVFSRGIGTFSISHISYLNPNVPKPEENVVTVASVPDSDRTDESSNCSSYTGNGFTLWNESVARKRNSGKENMGTLNVVKEQTLKEGQWPSDQRTQSSSNHCSSISPLLSSQAHSQKNQSFMETVKSARGSHSTEEDEVNLSLKRQSSSLQKGELRVEVDGRSCDQKPNTPRSKHSATEQRRRFKINDRFQMLRGLIPHSDQKRDKASFLLEVIEYIQFLQEKVNRYEGSYPGWNSEPTKLIPWRTHSGPRANLVDQPQVVKSVASPMFAFGAKLEEKDATFSSNIQRDTQIPAEPTAATNTMNFRMEDQQCEMTYNTASSSSPLQSNVYAPISDNCAASQPSTRLPSDVDGASLAQLQFWENKVAASEPVATAGKLKDRDLALESGTISISSIYSQGLLNTLTRALQISGVDLSQASISVQVDIGKRANSNQIDQDPIEKKVAEAPNGTASSLHTRVESINLESDRAAKRLKTG